MHSSIIIISIIFISLLNTIYAEDPGSSGLSETSTDSNPFFTTEDIADVQSNENIENNDESELDIESTDEDITSSTKTPPISESEAEEITGGGVWSSIGMIAVVICGCICLERLYSSCKKVYQKRTGRYGFSRLHNQTFNEFEDEDDDDEIDENLGHNLTTKMNQTKDDDSV